MPGPIITRAQWGAADPAGAMYPMRLPVWEVWIHHTVTRVSDRPLEDVREVQEVGFERGFSDISYSYLVHPHNGEVFEGRGLRWVGAHTSGRNSRSLGVALIGNYESRVLTDAQIESVRWLIWRLQREGAIQGTPRIGPHRHAPEASTLCPGQETMQRFELLREPWAAQPLEGPREPIAVGEDMEVEGLRIRTEFIDIPTLDDEGRGWVDVDADYDHVLSVVVQGSSPPDDGYWDPVVIASQPRGGKTRVTLAGQPHQHTGIFAKILEE